MNSLTEALVTIASAIVGLGIVAVLVSKNANTSAVIQSAASGFGNSLAVAESPVTVTNTPVNLSYPSAGFSGAFGPNSFG